MTKNKCNPIIKSHRPWVVRLTPEAVEFLVATTKYGASRLKAYLSLLQSAVETTTPYKPAYGRTFNLEAGQLVISITDLAEQWKWARETVRKFFDQLESFKLLTKESLDRCSLITMNIEWLDVGYPSAFSVQYPAFVMPENIPARMDEWLRGDISDEQLLKSISEAVDDFDNTDDYVLSYQIVGLQYSMTRQLIQQWETFNKEIPEVPDKHSRETLFRLFNSYLSGNWVLWLKLLRSYSIGVEPPVTIPGDSKETAFISNGRAILDSLFTHLNIIFDQDEL